MMIPPHKTNIHQLFFHIMANLIEDTDEEEAQSIGLTKSRKQHQQQRQLLQLHPPHQQLLHHNLVPHQQTLHPNHHRVLQHNHKAPIHSSRLLNTTKMVIQVITTPHFIIIITEADTKDTEVTEVEAVTEAAGVDMEVTPDKDYALSVKTILCMITNQYSAQSTLLQQPEEID